MFRKNWMQMFMLALVFGLPPSLSAQQTIDQWWQQNKDSKVGVTSGFAFYDRTVTRWITVNRVERQDPVLARDMKAYFLTPSKDSAVSDAYLDFVHEVAVIEDPTSPRYKYHDVDVEKFIALSIRAAFKERLSKLQIPLLYGKPDAKTDTQ